MVKRRACSVDAMHQLAEVRDPDMPVVKIQEIRKDLVLVCKAKISEDKCLGIK